MFDRIDQLITGITMRNRSEGRGSDSGGGAAAAGAGGESLLERVEAVRKMKEVLRDVLSPEELRATVAQMLKTKD